LLDPGFTGGLNNKINVIWRRERNWIRTFSGAEELETVPELWRPGIWLAFERIKS
jgi:hypothetical protein